MFGIGAQEIVIILVVALIVVGPQRLPELAGQVAKAIRDFRRMSDDLTGEFQRSIAMGEQDKPNPALTDQVITAQSTPDMIGSSIASSLRVETIPNDTTTTTEQPETAQATAEDAAPVTNTAMNEDTVISLAPVATKSDPLVGVSSLDTSGTYVGATHPAKAATAEESGDESVPLAEGASQTLAAETTDGGANTAPQNGISDAWDAVISTEATNSPVYAEADEAAPDVIAEAPYSPPARERIDPNAEPTIREKIEAQVAAEAFRERRRIASYQRGRKRD